MQPYITPCIVTPIIVLSTFGLLLLINETFIEEKISTSFSTNKLSHDSAEIMSSSDKSSSSVGAVELT